MRPIDADFDIVAGDTAPALSATLRAAPTDAEPEGAPIAITVNDDLAFEMTSCADGAPVTLDGTVTLVNGPSGQVRYNWGSAAETDVPGDYRGRFTIGYTDNTDESVPNRGEILIRVHPR